MAIGVTPEDASRPPTPVLAGTVESAGSTGSHNSSLTSRSTPGRRATLRNDHQQQWRDHATTPATTEAWRSTGVI